MTVKTIFAGTVTAGALALTGGFGYAATAGGGPAAPAPAVTSTVTPTAQQTQPASQHPATRPWCGDCCRTAGCNGTATRPAVGPTPGTGSGQYGYQGGGMCCGDGCQH
jgi:hypothetical protein